MSAAAVEARVSSPPPAPTLRVEVSEGLRGVAPRDWSALFPDHPDPYENVALAQRCGMDGFTFRTVVVRDDSGVLLIVPTFESVFHTSSMADGATRRIVRTLEPILPGVFRPRLLGIGLVECEWGAVGVRAGTSGGLVERAWQLAMDRVGAIARDTGANAIVMLELDPATLGRIPGSILSRFAPADTSPCAQTPLPFATVDAYLKSLSRSTRQSLRRRRRENAHLRIERTTDPRPHLERILDLYRQTVARAPVVLGVQRPAYFERICSEVPGAHYVLYSDGERLLGFNLLIARPGVLIDKYFCMEAERGRKHHLYFVSWMENIRSAIESGCALYHAGPGAEETKRHLGCRFVRTATLFRHTNPGAHAVLSLLARTVARGSTPQERERGAVEHAGAGA